MRTLFRRYYRDLVNGLLFRPILITLLHAVLAIVVVLVDRALEQPIFGGSPETARAVLTTIAGSSFTAVSIAFTVTIVTLQLVSSQFTPRALRGFLGRPWVQLVAGNFVGLVLYCLVVLGLMPELGDDRTYGLPATVAVVLAVLALFILLVFIHRISQSIQVSNIIADLVTETRDALERHYAADARDADPRATAPDPAGWPSISAPISGVVQSIDVDALLRCAARAGVTVRLAVQPGDFVLAGRTLAWLERGSLADLQRGENDGVAAVQHAVVCQSQRDIHMDPAFGVRQLADIAVRALSPGINDPSTADQCLHWLTAIFDPLLAEPRPARRRLTADGGVVDLPLRALPELLRTAFEEIALYGADNPRMRRAVGRTVHHITRGAHPSHADAVGELRRLVETLSSDDRDRMRPGVLEEDDPSDMRRS